MSALSALLPLVVITFIVVAVAAFARRRRNLGPAALGKSLPYQKKNYFFSEAERSFYEILRRLTPAHTIFAKVRLAELLYLPKNAEEWRTHWNKIDRKHVDFVVCDSNLAPVLAIELDDASHQREDRATRDAFVDRVFEAIGLPLAHVRAKRPICLGTKDSDLNR